MLISLAAVAAIGLTGCGGGGGSDSGDSVPADALVIEALDIKFDQEEYTAPAGATDIAYVSEGQQVHTLVVFDEKQPEDRRDHDGQPRARRRSSRSTCPPGPTR